VTPSKADLDRKQMKAEARRIAELDKKVEKAAEATIRGDVIREETQNKTKSAKRGIDDKIESAKKNRDKELADKKKAGQQASAKGNRVRARHEEALAAAKNMEAGGEAEENESGSEYETDSEEDEVEM
jgi:hypothetical protein